LPKLQTFDGPQLDELLAKVRREVGTDAKIVQARKLRTGGLGGFFSKETFRVEVELAPVAPKARAPKIAPMHASEIDALETLERPTSLLELADLVDEAEAEAFAVTPPPAPAPAPMPARVPVVETPTLFEAPEPQRLPARAKRPAPVPAAPPMVPTVREPAYVPSTERPSFNSVLNRIASEAGAPLPSPLDALDSFRGVTSTDSVHLTPRNASEGSRELLALGLPASMLPTDMSPGMAVARLLQSLQLPAAPPLPFQPGGLTVVVGERRSALRLATDVAKELLLDKRDVWIAEQGPEGRADRLSNPADAAAERRMWTDAPNVVALTAPPGARDMRWAESMLDALEPTSVWGIVGADRKTEDIAAWSDSLGGLDALALERLDQTVSPASVLQLGIPIARVDGQKATPALWAVLLAERLAA
jgi:hypothetical protein